MPPSGADHETAGHSQRVGSGIEQAPEQAALAEQRNFEIRGGPRRKAKANHGRPLLTTADKALIAVVCLRQICSQTVLSEMLEISQPPIGQAVTETGKRPAARKLKIEPTVLRFTNVRALRERVVQLPRLPCPEGVHRHRRSDCAVVRAGRRRTAIPTQLQASAGRAGPADSPLARPVRLSAADGRYVTVRVRLELPGSGLRDGMTAACRPGAARVRPRPGIRALRCGEVDAGSGVFGQPRRAARRSSAVSPAPDGSSGRTQHGSAVPGGVIGCYPTRAVAQAGASGA